MVLASKMTLNDPCWLVFTPLYSQTYNPYQGWLVWQNSVAKVICMTLNLRLGNPLLPSFCFLITHCEVSLHIVKTHKQINKLEVYMARNWDKESTLTSVPCELATLEVDLLAPVKLSDGCSLCWHLEIRITKIKALKPEPPC